MTRALTDAELDAVAAVVADLLAAHARCLMDKEKAGFGAPASQEFDGENVGAGNRELAA